MATLAGISWTSEKTRDLPLEKKKKKQYWVIVHNHVFKKETCLLPHEIQQVLKER
jgi:hypothetical protein